MESEKKSKAIIIILCLAVVLLMAAVVYLLFFNNKKEEPTSNESTPVSENENKKLYHIEDGEKFTIYGRTPGEDVDFIDRDKEISFAYPVIDIDSEEVRKINKEIYDRYQEDYNTNLKNESSEGCVAIKKNDKLYIGIHVISDTYRVFETDKYLSVIIITNMYTECAGGYNYYNGYVIDKNTKKVMSNSEIAKLFNASEKAVIDMYNENAETFDNEKASTIEEVRMFIYDNKLAIVMRGNGEGILLYKNGQFENPLL